MLGVLRLLGIRFLSFLSSLGRATLLWSNSMWGLPGWSDVRLVVVQIYYVGFMSLIIIVLSAFSIGAVLALQFYTQLARFGAGAAASIPITQPALPGMKSGPS